MPKYFLPIFPLKIVVFPNEKLNLHVFEARYRQMINECVANKTTFGIPAYIKNRLMTYGTEIELLTIAKTYENGSMDIKCRGKSVFKIDHVYNSVPDKLYSGAEVSFVETNNEADILTAIDILAKLQELYQFMKIKKTIPSDPVTLQTFDIAHLVGFNITQEYEFLCIPDEKTRQEVMLDHLIKFIPLVKEMEELRRKAQLNGHFKNLIPPKF